jgi:hypothetical protein
MSSNLCTQVSVHTATMCKVAQVWQCSSSQRAANMDAATATAAADAASAVLDLQKFEAAGYQHFEFPAPPAAQI